MFQLHWSWFILLENMMDLYKEYGLANLEDAGVEIVLEESRWACSLL